MLDMVGGGEKRGLPMSLCVLLPTDPCQNGGRWTGTFCLCPPNVDGARCQFGASTINLTAGKAERDTPPCPPGPVPKRDIPRDVPVSRTSLPPSVKSWAPPS